jgi:hypothetical protein
LAGIGDIRLGWVREVGDRPGIADEMAVEVAAGGKPPARDEVTPDVGFDRPTDSGRSV